MTIQELNLRQVSLAAGCELIAPATRLAINDYLSRRLIPLIKRRYSYT